MSELTRPEMDVRPEDIETLNNANISNAEWENFWENKLFPKITGLTSNQQAWRISRLSYLEGKQRAKEEMKEILHNLTFGHENLKLKEAIEYRINEM